MGIDFYAYLAEAGLFRSIWTTNFDGLVARAAAEFDITSVEIGIDSKERIFRQPEQNELMCVSLHGDYRYDPLKNTSKELQAQEIELRNALISILETHSLVIIGYSGRDSSIMDAIRTAVLQEDAVGKIFWCGFTDEPSNDVSSLLIDATEKKRQAYYVPGAAFDDVIARIALHCLEGTLLASVKRIIGDYARKRKIAAKCVLLRTRESDNTY